MKIWVYLNGLQQGPYTFDQVKLLPLDPTTLVWYDGLKQWLPAASAPVTAVLFQQYAPQQPYQYSGPFQSAPQQANSVQQPDPAQFQQYQQPQPQPQVIYNFNQPQPQQPMPPAPPTYMVWCILFTVLCCSPFGVAGIITGSISTSRYNSGDYDGAKRMSSATEWMLILSIVWLFIGTPLALIFGNW